MRLMFAIIGYFFCLGFAHGIITFTDTHSGTIWSYEKNRDGIRLIPDDGKPCCSPVPEGRLVIPGDFNGVPVYSIGDRSFLGCSKIERVEIPDSVKFIGESSFEQCHGLIEVVILSSITSRDENNDFCQRRIGRAAFAYCERLTRFDFCDGLIEIGCEAFMGCNSLKSVYLPDSLIALDPSAFCFCDALESVSLGRFVQSDLIWTFPGCENITNVSVRGIGLKYSSVAGILLNKEETDIYFHPRKSFGRKAAVNNGLRRIMPYSYALCDGLGKVTFPETVNFIGKASFMCSDVSEVVINEGVDKLGQYAFAGCTNLVSLTLPATLKEFEGNSVMQCDKLERIVFRGNVPSMSNLNLLPSNCLIVVSSRSIGWEQATEFSSKVIVSGKQESPPWRTLELEGVNDNSSK